MYYTPIGYIMEQGIIQHLHRIRGQIEGVEKMIENHKGCSSVLMQLAAVESSIQSVMKRILQEEAQRCSQTKNVDRNEKLVAIVNDLLRYS
jgi:DNA-binding FrmR family transcriptional regulator